MEMDNPLRKYFREPGLYIKLPTLGYFYDQDSLALSSTGEIAVYPMTAYDEIILKNPDALLNGDAIEKIIKSCAPGILKPRELCNIDVDAIMLAIKASTSGDEIEFETECPECGERTIFGSSIRYSLETCSFLKPEYKVELPNNVVVYVKPKTFTSTTKAAIMAFEKSKLIQEVSKQENLNDLEKNKLFRDCFEKVSLLNFELLSDSVIKVSTPQGDVTDKQFIEEWMQNIDYNTAKQIEAMINDISKLGIMREHEVECPKCSHKWNTSIIFDPSHFFG